MQPRISRMRMERRFARASAYSDSIRVIRAIRGPTSIWVRVWGKVKRDPTRRPLDIRPDPPHRSLMPTQSTSRAHRPRPARAASPGRSA